MSPPAQGHRPDRDADRAAFRRAGRFRPRRAVDRFIIMFQGFGACRWWRNVLCRPQRFHAGLDPDVRHDGAAIGSSPRADLYEALDRWLYRVPGGLVISNSALCIFAALTALPGVLRRHRQDGTRRCAARYRTNRTGSILRRRHARHPDPAFDYLHPLRHRTETRSAACSRRGPARPHAHRLFMLWTLFAICAAGSAPAEFRYTWKQKFQSIRRSRRSGDHHGVMYVLYGALDASEAAGVALRCAWCSPSSSTGCGARGTGGRSCATPPRIADDPDDHRLAVFG